MTKTEYEQTVEARIRDWQTAYDMLKLRAARADAQALSAIRDDLELLERHAHMLACRLAELKGCAEDGWERLSDGLEWSRQVAETTLQQVNRRLHSPHLTPASGFPNAPPARPGNVLSRGTA